VLLRGRYTFMPVCVVSVSHTYIQYGTFFVQQNSFCDVRVNIYLLSNLNVRILSLLSRKYHMLLLMIGKFTLILKLTSQNVFC